MRQLRVAVLRGFYSGDIPEVSLNQLKIMSNAAKNRFLRRDRELRKSFSVPAMNLSRRAGNERMILDRYISYLKQGLSIPRPFAYLS